MKKINAYIIALAVGFFVLTLCILPTQVASAAVDVKNSICGGVEISLDESSCVDDKICDSEGKNCKVKPGGSAARINSLISNIINILSLIVGIVAIVMIVVSGFKYVTSSGDAAKVTSAKTTIIYAIIGLVIVALAQFIVRFVIGKATQGPNATGP